MTTMKAILIEELSWAARMPRGGTAKELKVYAALRSRAGKVVMARTAAAGEPEEQLLVARLIGGENKNVE